MTVIVRFFLIFILLLVYFHGKAQSPGYLMGDQRAPSEKDIVRVDSITGIVNTDIPLDIGFYLVLKLKPTEELPIVKYFRVIGANREIDNEMGQSVDSVFRYKNELYILVPPLKPGRKYDFLLGKNIYGDTFRKVVKINFFQLNNEKLNH